MFSEKNKADCAGSFLLIVAAAALALPGCGRQGGRGRAENELVVISPHDETIRSELSAAFEKYSEEKTGKKAALRWQPARGTGNIMRLLMNEKKSAAGGREVGIDVFLGGGAPAHEKAAFLGITEPVKLPTEVLGAVPESLGGVHLRSETGYWFGVTLSSFGIITGKAGLSKRGLPEPSSWKDLADPRYEGLIILADPFESGSARACYEMILQRFGWKEGWRILQRIIANAGSFTPSSSDIAKEISSGQAVAGMVIDMYAFVQIEEDGADLIGFVLPEGETTFTPDPVSVIRGTPRKKLAALFVEFLLSEEGQALWILPPGEPGGPKKRNLWHFPVRPDAYEIHAGKTTLKSNPFESFASMKYDEKKGNDRARVITLLFETAGIQNKGPLRKAWKAVQAAPGSKLEEIFDAVPFGEEESFRLGGSLDDPVEAERLEEATYRLFKNKFIDVIEMGKK
jgi:iron(III) transport system substrate-binding protein